MPVLTEKPKYAFGQHVKATGFAQTLMIVDFVLIDRPGRDRVPGYNVVDSKGDLKLVAERDVLDVVPESEVVRREMSHD